jgi:hypothetical protein
MGFAASSEADGFAKQYQAPAAGIVQQPGGTTLVPGLPLPPPPPRPTVPTGAVGFDSGHQQAGDCLVRSSRRLQVARIDAMATVVMQDSQPRQHRWPLRPSIPQRTRSSSSRQHSRSRLRRRQPLHRLLRRLQRHRRAAAPAPCRACLRASTRAASWRRAAPRATSAPGPRWSCPRCKQGGRWRRRRCPSSSSRCTCGGSSRALPRRSRAQSLPQCNRCVLLLPPLHASEVAALPCGQ